MIQRSRAFIANMRGNKEGRTTPRTIPNYHEFCELHGTGDEVTSGPASGYVGS